MNSPTRPRINRMVAAAEGRPLQPVYGISGEANLEERDIMSLPGYRGMGPVRVGNQAFQQAQHDVYGSAILAATHEFFDRRLSRTGDEALFRRPEELGERGASLGIVSAPARLSRSAHLPRSRST